ncbi:MAG: type II secretion system protein [Cellulosilyticaceae bacterium]
MKTIKKPGEKGMTLIEVMITLLIGNIFLIMLVSFMTLSSRQMQRMVADRDVEVAYESLRQFVLEETYEAKTVCVRVYTDATHAFAPSVYMCHEGHNSSDVSAYRGIEKPIESIVFDKDKKDSVGNDLQKTLQVRHPNVGGAEGLMVMFQGNPLVHEASETGVPRLKGASLLTDGQQFYMRLTFEDALGEVYEGCFRLPLEDKGVAYVTL